MEKECTITKLFSMLGLHKDAHYMIWSTHQLAGSLLLILKMLHYPHTLEISTGMT